MQPPEPPRFGHISAGPAAAPGSEAMATLLEGSGTAVVRIASLDHRSAPGFWYDSPQAEFVLLVSGAARLGFADGAERALRAGDWAILPPHCRHRIAWTDPAAETLWLAVHLPPG